VLTVRSTTRQPVSPRVPPLRMCAAVAATLAVGSCTTYPTVDGDYWWYGSRIYFVDGKYGAKSELRTMRTHATTVRLLTEQGKVLLEIPECGKVELRRSGDRGQILTGGPQNCELSPAQQAFGLTRRGLLALQIDLDRRVMHERFCESGTATSGCGTDDAVFVRLEDAKGYGGSSAESAGGAGGASNGSDGSPSLTAESTGSAAHWAFGSGDATLWICDEVDLSGPGCVADEGLLAVRHESVTGTVHELPDGRFYLDGFDCFAPPAYDGEPLPCVQSLDGLSQIPSPDPHATRFVVEGDHLSFEAEMVGADFSYYVRLEAALTSEW